MKKIHLILVAIFTLLLTSSIVMPGIALAGHVTTPAGQTLLREFHWLDPGRIEVKGPDYYENPAVFTNTGYDNGTKTFSFNGTIKFKAGSCSGKSEVYIIKVKQPDVKENAATTPATIFNGPGGSCTDKTLFPEGNIVIGDQSKSNIATGSGTGTGAAAGTPGSGDDSCESKGGALGWILCPVILIMDSALNFVDTQIQRLLEVDTAQYDNPEIKQAWGAIRNIAYIILVPIMLIMIIGTAAGSELFSAYTVKKALPRMFAAILFITLSYLLCTFLIKLSNVVGGGTLGLITSPFNGLVGGGKTVSTLSLADLFSGASGNSGALSAILAVPKLVVFGIGLILVLWFFGITVLLFAGTAFLVLLLRQIFVVALLLVAPLAILAWIFPGNDKLWKSWWSAFSKLLIMFPLIMAIIAMGRVFAVIINADRGGSFQGAAIAPLAKLAAYMLPYAFIPFTFKFAGGLFATVSGMANDKSKGLFDRQKQKRAANWQGYKAGTKAPPGLRGNSAAARGFQRIGAGVGAGWKGRGGFGEQGKERMARLKEVATARNLKENEELQQLAVNSDEGIALSGLAGGTAAGGRIARDDMARSWREGQYHRDRVQTHLNDGMNRADAERQADADVEVRADRAYAAAAAVGFSRENSQAALQLTAQNKARAIEVGDMDIIRRGAERLAPNNTRLQTDLVDGFQFHARQGGRFDVGGDSVAAGMGRGSLYQIANGHPSSITGMGNELAERVSRGDVGALDDAAVFRHELDAMLPNTTGDVRDAILRQQAELDATQAIRNHMDTVVINPATGNPETTQQRVNYVPGAALPPGTRAWNPEEMARGWRTEQRARTIGDLLQSRARTYQREDPNNLNGTTTPSDRRLKKNIRQMRVLETGIILYQFQYLWSDQIYVGVMAQDLIDTHPETLSVDKWGYYGVNYELLGLRMLTLEEWLEQENNAYV